MPESLSLAASGEQFDVHIARPEGEPIGGLVVIHEIWGLVEHIRDVADRFAELGWLVAAPDILTRGGLEPALGEELFAVMNSADEEARTAAQPRMRDALSGTRAPEYAGWAVAALEATVDWLAAQPGVGGRLAVTGFCFGGTYAFLLAADDDRIRAAAPFYGTAPSPADIAKIRAPILALYGRHDPSLIDALPDVVSAMSAAGVDFEPVVYPDSAHAFFNDAGRRYNPVDATDAWTRVTRFLRAHV
ncbi:dienelactone hydrolase family protein [Microbacterium ulmi]|uniref:Dienelactone hydrolase family protein n=1 Tax=Microbacterium ulmi TaxID=179095 RepID=A0A7Y2M084_9MICO|nr:dienelactone hydrolase family protein [Microbacterium ulmi]NII70643.1 carboxymethylenebutenolidase [Microbacterium ulmi]NNH04116.1 dienelactone hydrolase family protein [Microbacterium ulmi]